MQVTIESLSGLQRRMTFGIPEQRIYDAVQTRVRELARHVKLDGFRKGKVPLAVVDLKLGPQVRQEVIGDLLLSTFYEAAAQEKLKLASQPHITLKPPLSESAEAAPEFTAVFEVYPEFELAPVAAIHIERPVVQMEAADVDGMLAALQRLHLEWVAVERPAQTGDRVLVDLQGYMDDEPLREIRQIPFILGRPAQGEAFGSIVQDEFARQIEGVEPGKFVDMDIGFPEEYPKAYLAGQTVRFTLHLRSVEEPRLPALDDAFALKLGVTEGGGIDALREQTRAMMEEEVRQAERDSLKSQVLDALLAQNPLELPKARVEAEAAQMLEAIRTRMKADGLKDEEVEIAALLIEAQARRRIALGLILAKIVRENALSVPKESLDAILQTLAPGEGGPEAAEWQSQREERLAEVESAVLEDMVVDWVLEKASVVDKPTRFADFMQDRLKDGVVA